MRSNATSTTKPNTNLTTAHPTSSTMSLPTSGANDDGAPAPLLDIDPTDQPAPAAAAPARVGGVELEQVIQRTNPQAAAPLQYQVAGHQNVMSDESGSLVIKVSEQPQAASARGGWYAPSLPPRLAAPVTRLYRD